MGLEYLQKGRIPMPGVFFRAAEHIGNQTTVTSFNMPNNISPYAVAAIEIILITEVTRPSNSFFKPVGSWRMRTFASVLLPQ